MKKRLLKSNGGLSLISTALLIFFILIAYASLDLTEVVDLGGGVVEENSYIFHRNIKKTTTGKRDANGRWNGLVTIKYVTMSGNYYEEAHMANGKRQGLSTLHFMDGTTHDDYYVNDIKINEQKAATKMATSAGAFDILSTKYPWYQFSLNALGFDDVYIQTFLGSLQMIMDENSWVAADFDDQFNGFYEDAIDSLTKTPFDTLIIEANNLYTLRGIDEMKNAEFRLAVLDHLRNNQPTYQVIESNYGHYLTQINDNGVTSEDFEQFCNDFDDTLALQGPIGVNGTLFPDSADEQMYNAMSPFISKKKSAMGSVNLQNWRTLISDKQKVEGIRTFIAESSQGVSPAGQVFNDISAYYLKGDMLRNILRETYSLKLGVETMATVGIALESFNSATSVSLKGYIVSNGGSELTGSGICWSTSFNPEYSDTRVENETNSDVFTFDLTGLTEGETYYARTYATNLKGIAYSNCIEFVPVAVVNQQQTDKPMIMVYPNPNAGSAHFSIWLDMPGDLSIKVYDMKGQLVMVRNLGFKPQGQNSIQVDFSGIPDGVYNCVLQNGLGEQRNRIVIER
jgi:hypothetical protein